MRLLMILSLCCTQLDAVEAPDWSERLAAARAQLPASDLSEAPLAYLEITGVVSGSTAEAIGLQPGDRLARIDDQASVLRWHGRPVERSRSLHWWRRGEGWKQATVPPGPVGFHMRPRFDLTAWCLRERQVADPKLLMAAGCWDRDPAVARHLLAQVEPDVDAIARRLVEAMVALAYGEAAATCRTLLELAPGLQPELATALWPQVMGAALRCGEPTLYPAVRETMDQLGQALLEFPMVSTPRPGADWPLAAQVSGFRDARFDIDPNGQWSSDQLVRLRQPDSSRVPPAHNRNQSLTAPAGSLLPGSGHRIAFDLRLSSSGPPHPMIPSAAGVMLEDGRGRHLVYLAIYERRDEPVGHWGMWLEQPRPMMYPLPVATRDDWHHVELWQLGQAVEILVDGLVVCRYTHSQLSSQPLLLTIQNTGTQAEYRNFRWHECLTAPDGDPLSTGAR